MGGKRGKKRQRGEEEEVIEDKAEKDSTVNDFNNKVDDSAPVSPS